MAIELKFDDESNEIRLGTLTMRAKGNRVLVVGDEYRSGYECATCDAVGYITCNSCNGTGTSMVVKDGRCSKCQGAKTVVCPKCKGKRETIVIPDDKKPVPTTGRIVSIGPDVRTFKTGESAIFTSFSGHRWVLKAEDIHGNEVEVDLWCLREDELLAEVIGHTQLRQVRKSMAMATVG